MRLEIDDEDSNEDSRPETENNSRGINNDSIPKAKTVRDALKVHNWLVKRQALLNWSVLTQSLVNMMTEEKEYYLRHQTGVVDFDYGRQQLEWMSAARNGIRNKRHKTTEKIMTSITTLLLGSATSARHLPSGLFHPLSMRAAKFKWRDQSKDTETEESTATTIKKKKRKTRSKLKKQKNKDSEHIFAGAKLGRRKTTNVELLMATPYANIEDDPMLMQDDTGYKGSIPEMGSFPSRRGLFKNGSHKGVSSAWLIDAGSKPSISTWSANPSKPRAPRRPATARAGRERYTVGGFAGLREVSTGNNGPTTYRRPRSARSAISRN